MSLHFVTSAQPQDHIYSSDEARKTEGMIGSGGFVLGVKDKLVASMIDANTLRILEGDIIFCGRQVNITNYEEVTIQNGTPGMNSIALVVLNMKTDPSEEATIKVYEGTETDGEPVMPEYIEGDLNNGDTEAEMPLYAITKTGLSVSDPVAQFDVWVSEKEFRTSIAPTFYQTEKQTAMMPGTSNHMFNFALDLPDGYTACALQYLSIASSNAACVAGSYRIVDNQLNVNVRNTSGAQISADVEASILCLRLP